METYSTWEYYRDEYRGRLKEPQYAGCAVRAKAAIDRLARGRAAGAAGMEEKLCACECELADAIQSFMDGSALLPKGVKSVNNDGFSVTAEDMASEAETYRAICMKYLVEPVNLLYRGLNRGLKATARGAGSV